MSAGTPCCRTMPGWRRAGLEFATSRFMAPASIVRQQGVRLDMLLATNAVAKPARLSIHAGFQRRSSSENCCTSWRVHTCRWCANKGRIQRRALSWQETPSHKPWKTGCRPRPDCRGRRFTVAAARQVILDRPRRSTRHFAARFPDASIRVLARIHVVPRPSTLARGRRKQVAAIHSLPPLDRHA